MRRTFKMRHAAATAIFAAVVGGVAPEADATVLLAGNSNSSTFSNCVGCGAGSTSTALHLSSFTLDIDPITFSTPSDQTGLVLAELKLVTENGPTGTASFKYNLVLNFTTPVGTASETFNLSMSATGTGSNSDEKISGLALNLTDPLVISNVKLSNFRFVDTNNSTSGTMSGGTWDVQGHSGNYATLDLVADVTDPVAAPEPASLALMGTALMGMGLLRRKRKAG